MIEEKITAAVSFLFRVLAGEARKLLDAGKDPGTVRVIAKKTQDNTFAMVGRQLLAVMKKRVHADKRAFGHVQKESLGAGEAPFPQTRKSVPTVKSRPKNCSPF